MKTQVTIIPSDNLIIVDGMPIELIFYPDEYFHALQWYKGRGQVEYGDRNLLIENENEYTTYVAPYVALWEGEYARLEEKKRQAEAEYNSPESIAQRKIVEIKAELSRLDTEYIPSWVLANLAIDPNDSIARERLAKHNEAKAPVVAELNELLKKYPEVQE